MTLTPLQQVAQQLDGQQYPNHVSRETEELAKTHGIVIVFGRSDDLVEFRGAIHDEDSAWEGGVTLIDLEGVVPINADGTFRSDEPNSIQKCRPLIARLDRAIAVTVFWGQGEWTWSYKLPDGIEYETFGVYDDDEHYCQGLVFKLPEVAT